MKRTFILISCLAMALATCMAQSIAELFKGDKLLTSVFVNPLGIQDLPDDADAVSVENQLKASGKEYKRMSLGPFGEVFTIAPTDLMIGETPVAAIAICVSNDSIMLLYLSESSESYRSMYVTLSDALATYAKNIEPSDTATDHHTYMLSDTYGITIGTDQSRQTSIACLLDIKNLKDFLNLSTILPN